MKSPIEKLHVKFFMHKPTDLANLQRIIEIDLFRSSMRKIDGNNITIEAYVPREILKKIKPDIRYRILGDVSEIVKTSQQYVSKTNRYKTKS